MKIFVKSSSQPKPVDVATLKSKLKSIVVDTMVNKLYWERLDAEKWSRVDITSRNGYINIEVGAEVDYDGLILISEALNTEIAKYDSEAYFEPYDAGILVAYIAEQ